MKKILTLLLSFVLILSATGCGGEKDTKPVNQIKVWSTYSTAKVMFDKSLNGNYTDLGQKLDVSLAKNEKEMAQVIITAEYAVDNYSVSLSDLKSGENVFSKENIEVYHQKAINVVTKTTGNYNDKYPKGLTPDAIIPLSVAIKAGENKVNEKSNQPVSFEFFAPSDQPAGIYTGNFEFFTDGEKFDVPVSVTVWDYQLPESTTGKSCMLIYQNQLFYGEMDASDEMYTNYFESLLDNKLNAWHVPGTATSPEKMVESVMKYWDHPNFNCYGMPDLSNGINPLVEEQKKYLLALGKASTEDKILFDKAYFYHTCVDEPNMFPEKRKNVLSVMEQINNLFDEVLAELDSENFFNGNTTFKKKMEKSLKNIPQIITSPYDPVYEGTENSNLTYCPTIKDIHSKSDRNFLASHAEEHKERNVETWTYTCNNPMYPYPSTHIDDYLIGSRIMRWMQKSYDITGYLAWSVNQYSKVVPFDNEKGVIEINPYIDPQRVSGNGDIANGDGYLFYPGKRYESKNPMTSIRLKALRDGQDDYDAISVLENKYNELATFYDAKNMIDANKTLSFIYDKLFSGTIYNSDDIVFDSARKTLAQMITDTDKDEKFVYDIELFGNQLKVTAFANNGYNVKINGTDVAGTVSGQGLKFEKTILLSDFDGIVKMTVNKGDYTKDYTVNYGKVNSAVDFNSSDVGNLFSVKKENTFAVADGKADIIINSVDKGNDSSNVKYLTGFTLKSVAFNKPFTNINKIYFDVENLSDKEVSFTIYLNGENSRYEIASVNLAPSAKTTVFVDRVYDTKFSELDKVSGMFFAFRNATRNESGVIMLGQRHIALGNIYFTEK